MMWVRTKHLPLIQVIRRYSRPQPIRPQQLRRDEVPRPKIFPASSRLTPARKIVSPAADKKYVGISQRLLNEAMGNSAAASPPGSGRYPGRNNARGAVVRLIKLCYLTAQPGCFALRSGRRE